MAKVITFSTTFPDYHPKSGQPTWFIEKFYNSLYARNNLMEYPVGIYINESVLEMKHHTLRLGRRWKKGDLFSPRVWSGKPYNSKQIIIGPDIEIKKLWDVVILAEPNQTTILLPTQLPSTYEMLSLGEVAKNDGLSIDDFESWFNPQKKSLQLEAQIICWNGGVRY